ncbi:DUF5712 family protein [Spirosoma pollinicola]|uniref:Mobilization protein n=1 Tax=Spirosoma pollinicola TaxID=2057025 RepID=A0A2K8Z9E1_9BACT|nr:DUF5712 family protein [Spirosoma pollinicola]AUD06487.1 hypothetical protein CWM47_34370 [Spirosoma pollinicola]
MQTKFTSPIKANNKGSCSKLVNYLEKENDKNLSVNKEYFFSSDRDKCNKWEVIQQIDNNAKGQKIEKEQDRFFSIVIAPSQTELAHIGNDPDKLKEYTRQTMENYAAGFCNNKGENRGLESKDLVWYAKIENERKYSTLDAEVKEGLAKNGQLKVGDQRHVHIIVSRCEARENRHVLELEKQKQEQTIHLCPSVNNQKIFNRDEFIRQNEQDFDKRFAYNRSHEESYDYCNSLKNGKQQDYEKIRQRGKEKIFEKGISNEQDHEIGY